MSRPFRAKPIKRPSPRALPWASMFDPVGVAEQDRVGPGTSLLTDTAVLSH